jgi:SAM-dependent methyltransferase
MNRPETDLVFTGSIPELYERYLVPMIFQTYADDLATRLAEIGPTAVLEVAAGTGVVTRALASRLPPATAITATDLNQPMIDYAATIGTSRPVSWRQADAMALPFDDASFDAVVCQFGAMFFPDRATAYAEMFRVLRRGGVAVFNVWDSLEQNHFAQVVNDAVATLFPDDPPQFFERTPHGYYDTDQIRSDFVAAGFADTSRIDTLEARSRADTCMIAAVAFCQGTPLRNEIESRDPGGLAEATAVVAAAISDSFGPTDIDGKIQAFVITADKP